MTRQQSFVRGILVLAIALMSIATAVPVRTHAQSPHSSDRVWVAEDHTAAMLKTCTSDGHPCPPGSVHSILMYTMPLAQAESEHRPYIALSATRAEVDSFFHQAYPPTEPPAPRPLRVIPADCPSPSTDNWSSTVFGGYYTVYMTYWGDETCGGSQVSAISDRETFNGGHGIWLHGPNYVYSGGTYRTQDNAGSCDGLGATYTYSSPTWTKNWGSDKLSIEFSSGSHCTFFDTTETDDFYWY